MGFFKLNKETVADNDVNGDGEGFEEENGREEEEEEEGRDGWLNLKRSEREGDVVMDAFNIVG